MSHELIGQTCALLTAVSWATGLIFFKRSGETLPPIGLNLLKNVVAIVLIAATLPFEHLLEGPEAGDIRHATGQQVAILAVSGILGIAIADTLFFYALNLIGVGLAAIVECLYSPLTIFFAAIMLGEHVTGFLLVGGGLILSGVYICSRHKPPVGRTRAQIVAGILVGALAIALIAFGIVLAKQVLDQFSTLQATSVRLIAGTIALVVVALVMPRGRRRTWAVFRPTRAWRAALPGAFFGTYLAMVLWVAGFKYTSASTAALLNQTSMPMAVVFAALFLGEPLGGRKISAVLLAAAGVILVISPAVQEWLLRLIQAAGV